MKLILALGTLAMLAALWAYAHHRPPEASAPLWREEWDECDDMCPNCLTPWRCNGPHEPLFV